MKKIFISFLAFSCLAFSLMAQIPQIQWQKCYGGGNDDVSGAWNGSGDFISQTSDGGYVSVSTTYSNNGDVTGNHGSGDIWVAKLNSLGTIQWQKCLGGTGLDEGFSIKQTSDGGYVVLGITQSNNGDVSGNHGNGDVWLVKLSGLGAIQWQKCLGGTSSDYGYAIIETLDGGLALSGYTWSNNGDVNGNHSQFYSDLWLVKLSGLGAIQWQKCLGGNTDDYGAELVQLSDSSFLIAGYVNSPNIIPLNHGTSDAYVAKISKTGVLIWQKCYGGSGAERFSSIRISASYIVLVGFTSSNNGDASGNKGTDDVWVVKINPISGVIVFQQCYGGLSSEWGNSIVVKPNGSIIVVGSTYSNNGNASGNHGNLDMLVFQIDALGNIEWQRCYGSTDAEEGQTIIPTTDGGYLLGGSTYSYPGNGDVSGNYSQYHSDVWLVKLAPTTPMPIELISFEAKVVNNEVNLSWVTASENNNLYFRIEKSSDELNWKYVSTVNSYGNSMTHQYYELIDGDPIFGKSYYRLVQVDVDGIEKVAGHRTVILEFQPDIKIGQDENYIYVYGAPFESRVTLYDIQGRLIVKDESGTIGTSDFSKGIYIIRVMLRGELLIEEKIRIQ